MRTVDRHASHRQALPHARRLGSSANGCKGGDLETSPGEFETNAVYVGAEQMSNYNEAEALREEKRNEEIGRLTNLNSANLRAKLIARDMELLSEMSGALVDRMSQDGIAELLVQTASMQSHYAAGALLDALVTKCIDAQAELDAIREVEKLEAEAKNDADNYFPSAQQTRQGHYHFH